MVQAVAWAVGSNRCEDVRLAVVESQYEVVVVPLVVQAVAWVVDLNRCEDVRLVVGLNRRGDVRLAVDLNHHEEVRPVVDLNCREDVRLVFVESQYEVVSCGRRGVHVREGDCFP